jgi:hypothetical protein
MTTCTKHAPTEAVEMILTKTGYVCPVCNKPTVEKIAELEKRLDLLEKSYSCNAHPHFPVVPIQPVTEPTHA